MNLISILKQILQEEKSKRDRCLRIADRKFDKPSAYKSGAVVRCRKGKIWKGIKEGEEQLNIQDLAYKQIPGLLEKGIERELEFLSDIMDETLEDTKNLTNPEIKRVPLKSIKPSQQGEDYKNPSSESEAEEFRKILNGEKNVEDHREGDLHPILVNRTTNKIIDGNHRHYALLAANSPYAVVLYVDVPREYLNEDINTNNKINLAWEDFIKNEDVNIKELRDELGLDLNSFKTLYIKTLNKLNKLKFPLKIYRALSIGDGNKINYNNLGNHWTFNKDSAEPYSGDYSKNTIILVGEVMLQDIDIITTIAYNLLIPSENEIYVNNPSNIKLKEILKEDESLRTWFKRKGAPGKTGGWVDCNSPIRKDGKITGYKPCGRQKGEIRSKYPSCRPTPSKCKDPGKGKKWGKTK